MIISTRSPSLFRPNAVVSGFSLKMNEYKATSPKILPKAEKPRYISKVKINRTRFLTIVNERANLSNSGE